MLKINFEGELGTNIVNKIIRSESCLNQIYHFHEQLITLFRSSHPEVFLVKGVLKKCSKFTGEHPCQSVISIKLQSNIIEITFRHGYFPVKLLHIFRKSFFSEHVWVAAYVCWKIFSVIPATCVMSKRIPSYVRQKNGSEHTLHLINQANAC